MPAKIIYLSLGSNVGDRLENLRTAIALLPDSGVRVLRESSVYETEPVDLLEQPWFFNEAVEAETDLEPRPLLQALRGIESAMGSRKTIRKGPRLIDLDILFYGEEKIEIHEVQIPHPRMHLRRFVLVPLEEIAPSVRHPVLGVTVAELLASVADRSQVRRATLNS